MVYADYEFYVSQYLNERAILIQNNDFNYYASKASNIINKATYGKATPLNEVKLCCCALAELLYNKDNETNIASEKVGEHSVNYTQTNSEDLLQLQNTIITDYLANTGLLYCGVM